LIRNQRLNSLTWSLKPRSSDILITRATHNKSTCQTKQNAGTQIDLRNSVDLQPLTPLPTSERTNAFSIFTNSKTTTYLMAATANRVE
jgi:hypothetical protein